MLKFMFFGFCWLIQSLGWASQISPIPAPVKKLLLQYTWHKGCPVAINHLRYLVLDYWGYDEKPHQGAMIVNQVLAQEVRAIFDALYQHHFPIERIDLMEHYQGDDLLAMQNNVTSAFNCRAVTGNPNAFSQHSYGRAIDINPLVNPYVKGAKVSPEQGRIYVSRHTPFKGKITVTSLVYKEFRKHGWSWGGRWPDLQDYQHFEKRAKGDVRIPSG